MNNKFYVYAHIRNDTGEVFYVGKGFGGRAYQKNKRSTWWNRIVNKHGYRVEILHDNLDEQTAFDLEMNYIHCYGRSDLQEGSLVNLTDGGEGCSGRYPSEETRNKLSESQRGEKNHMFGKYGIESPSFGKHHSEETRKKMSEKIFSEETRQKISESKRGEKNSMFGKTGAEHPMFRKHHSEETRKKMSESKKGENHPNFGKHHSEETRKKIRDAWARRRLIKLAISSINTDIITPTEI